MSEKEGKSLGKSHKQLVVGVTHPFLFFRPALWIQWCVCCRTGTGQPEEFSNLQSCIASCWWNQDMSLGNLCWNPVTSIPRSLYHPHSSLIEVKIFIHSIEDDFNKMRCSFKLVSWCLKSYSEYQRVPNALKSVDHLLQGIFRLNEWMHLKCSAHSVCVQTQTMVTATFHCW